MMKNPSPAERLIVAADFKPDTMTKRYRDDAWSYVSALARQLKGTGVYLKVNSALRACGYELIDEIHSEGLRVFADLKLIDIPHTLSSDGILLREANPELLTVTCTSGISAMKALKAELPDTEVLGVTVLTSLAEVETLNMFHATVEASVMKFAMLAESAGVDGLICAPTEVGLIKSVLRKDMTFNTPGVRPAWTIVLFDDQNQKRVMTPAQAIRAGATRVVIGRPIANLNGDPYRAIMRTLDEIASVTV